jgi:hypothetical protein
VQQSIVRHRSGRRRRGNRLPAAVALVLSAAVIWQASYSAFAVTAANQGNTWQTGQLSLSTTATALFDTASNSSGMTVDEWNGATGSARSTFVTFTWEVQS